MTTFPLDSLKLHILKTLAISLLLIISPPSKSENESCSSLILKEKLQDAYEVCFLLKDGSLTTNRTNGLLKKNFGTITEPGRAAILLKTKAESGDPGFQYFWSKVLRHVYAMQIDDLNESNSQKYLELTEKFRFWLRLSADAGFLAAMIDEIELFLSAYSTGTVEEKLIMKGYARALALSNIPDASQYLAQVNSKATDEDVEQDFKGKVSRYKELSTIEILELASSLNRGRYRNDQGIVRFSKDRAKSEELYLFLIEVRKDTESSFLLAKMIGREDEKRSLKYYQLAAEQQHAKAITWVGDYLYCKGQKELAIKYLKRAKAMNHPEADDSLGEIEAWGEVSNCVNGWIN
jgi:TPR repeat protein